MLFLCLLPSSNILQLPLLGLVPSFLTYQMFHFEMVPWQGTKGISSPGFGLEKGMGGSVTS